MMNSVTPLVNIMVPVYNGLDTLPMALSSLSYQTHTNWKCIIVNDGSTDGTKAFLDSLKDNRFQIVHLEKNRGRPYARQIALDAAEGEFISFLDADDFYHPQKLERQLHILKKYPEVVLTCCANGCYNANMELETLRGKGAGVPLKFNIGDRKNVVLRTAMVRLEEAKKFRFNVKLKLAEDTDFIDRLLNGKLFLTVPDVLYYYSEFVSVTKAKILKSNYYAIRCAVSLIKNSPVYYSKRIAVNGTKILLKLIAYPFVSVDFYLNRRGKKTTEREQAEFKAITDQLNKYLQ